MVGTPSSQHVRMIRTAISPRFATRMRVSATFGAYLREGVGFGDADSPHAHEGEPALADDRIPLLATGKDIEFPAGRMIVEEGSIGTDFYLILSGDATVSKGGRVIRRLRPGDFFGEISLLDGGPR